MNEWLEQIGLQVYKDNFKKAHIKTSTEMEVLKSFNRSDIENELEIKKIGKLI